MRVNQGLMILAQRRPISGYAGFSVKTGVVDTGVDSTHSQLSSVGMAMVFMVIQAVYLILMVMAHMWQA